MKKLDSSVELSDSLKLKLAVMVIYMGVGFVILILTFLHYYCTEVYL